MPKTLFCVLTGLILAGLSACTTGDTGDPLSLPAAVEVAEVLVEPATVWRDFTGRVAAPETVELRPRVSGYIDDVAFTEGALVRKGDVLFTIDQRPYRARMRAAEAELSRLRSQLKVNQSEAERARQLLDSHAISREEYDRRLAASDTAHAAVRVAEAVVERARLDLYFTEVTAPIDGRAGRAFVTRGNLAAADKTLLTTLVSVDPMHVYFDADQRSFADSREFIAAKNRPQLRISLSGEDRYPHAGELDFIDNRLNNATGTIQFRAVIVNPDDIFKPGQFARVRMSVQRLDSAMLVKSVAILTDQDRRYVYVLSNDDRAERRDVEPGPGIGDLVLIRSGLEAGERVVVNGQQKIRVSGTPVRPIQVAMREAEPPQLLSAR